MVRVNCAAIPATLIESELFGREKGAFTGALARQVGRFELANHSTIFLDEIGDLPPDVQVKLLRVLEERQIERLGSPSAIRVDVADHRGDAPRSRAADRRRAPSARTCSTGSTCFPIQVPPLRVRVEDIPLLVWRFVDEFSKAFGKRIDAISRESMAALQRYPWPGNIRELRNVVERAMILTAGHELTIRVPLASVGGSRNDQAGRRPEGSHSERAREYGLAHSGNAGAADLLGLKPTTLETRMAKVGLSRRKAF